MPVATPCPDLRHYQSLVSGQLAVADKEALLQHLEGCDSCVQKIQSLPGQDTLIEWIKQARTVAAPPVEQQLAALMQRMIQLVQPAAGASVSVAGSVVASKAAPPAGTLTFSCGSCKKPLRVKQEAAGKKVKCPHCKQVVLAPAATPAAPPEAMETAVLPPAATSQTATVANLPASSKEQELCAFLSPSQAPDEIGRLGSYRVLKVLGAGGMGVVFRAEDPQLQRLVALKAMLPALAENDAARQRFLREARAAASLKHDHIVTIHQVGEDRGAPFLAMEFLEGEALEDRLKREGKLPLAEVLRIGREIADGLQAAHEHGLIHRDIKPANVWLEKIPERGASAPRCRVKILDFGLARFSGDEVHLTQSGAIVGTPAYMPPEQARGESVDARCDLYSLGCVLYRLCTGELPFKADNTMSLLLALATEQPKSPREINADVPPPLADLILRLLAKEPAQRPATAGEVAETLQDIAVEKPLASAAATPPAPPRRRRKLLLAAAAGAFLFAAMLTVIVIHLGGPEEGTVTIKTVDPNIELVFNSGGKDIIVRDKQNGDEIKLPLGSYKVALNGGKDELKLVTNQFTLERGGRALVEVTWQRGGKQAPERAEIPPPVQMPEPPPLAEWLKGRKVLTVSQDGKGQFQTIQAALNALQSHQVVKVLDRGPYRERLEIYGLPPDIGLISEQGTVLELPAWQYGWKEEPLDYYVGHTLGKTDGFRFSGFAMQCPERKDGLVSLLYLERPDGFVLENCRVPRASSGFGKRAVTLIFNKVGACKKPICVRECWFEGGLFISSGITDTKALVERNYFYHKNTDEHLCVWGEGGFEALVIRHNLFAGPSLNCDIKFNVKGRIALDFSNNTMTSSNPSLFEVHVPKGTATIRNNLHTRPGLLGLWSGAEKDHEAFRGWLVGPNCYPGEAEVSSEHIFPRAASDILAEPQLLSMVPSDVDYLRLPADSFLAKAGAGGAWPSYIGALPPGPAPKEGDWFTRLRQRWGDFAPAVKLPSAPVQIPEPPPLAEWLKGRKILTVSQDGKGQFKKIQAALDALKPHEVIQVLDRGPYYERLELQNVPQDTGLISEVKTVLELRELQRMQGYREAGRDTYKGHFFVDTDGFRLSGFHFILPSVDELAKLPGGFIGQGIRANRPGGFVFENCKIQEPANSAEWQCLFLGFYEGGSTKPACVRDCFIEGRLGIASSKKDASASALIERNYLKDSGKGPVQLMLNGPGSYGTVAIRHNILCGSTTEADLMIPEVEHVKALEVSNNILYSSARAVSILVEAKVPRGAIRFQNNLALRPGFLLFNYNIKKQQVEEPFRTWQIGHNAYARLLAADEESRIQFPQGPGDVLGRTELLSHEPENADYLRIPAASPLAKAGAGGAWPSYIGALPPGPAPKDGDWFTRLRQKWRKDNPAANKKP